MSCDVKRVLFNSSFFFVFFFSFRFTSFFNSQVGVEVRGDISISHDVTFAHLIRDTWFENMQTDALRSWCAKKV